MSEDDNHSVDIDNPEIPVPPAERLVVYRRGSESSSSSDTSGSSGISGCSEPISDYWDYLNTINFEDMTAELSDYGSEDEVEGASGDSVPQRRKQLEKFRKKLATIRKKVKKHLLSMMARFNDDAEV